MSPSHIARNVRGFHTSTLRRFLAEAARLDQWELAGVIADELIIRWQNRRSMSVSHG